MAIRDALTSVSTAQAITATAVSTNAIDLGLAGRDIGNGQPLYLNVAVLTTFTNAAGTGTLTFQLVTSAVTGLTSPVVHTQSQAFLKTALTAGATLSVLLTPEVLVTGVPLRFLGVNYLVGTENFTGGTLTAWFSVDPIQGWKPYADTVN
jgi:hypothetical protein